MPLSKTDPTRYAEAGSFMMLAKKVANFETFETTFESPGDAASFSQRFYTFRKAVEYRVRELKEKQHKAQAAKDPAKKAQLWTNEDVEELNIWLPAYEDMKDIVIRRPGQGQIRMTTLTMDSIENPRSWEDKINKFLEKE